MSTECVHCKNRKFETFEEYAVHILERHATDDIRVSWAREILFAEEKTEEPECVSPFPYVPPPPLEDETDHSEIDEALSVLLRPEVLEKLRKLK